MDFDSLTMSGCIDYDILVKEHESISLNDIVWVKVNKAAC